MRVEKDFLGEMQVPANALYGIHSLRACINFPTNQLFRIEWYNALAKVKQAYYLCYSAYRTALLNQYKKEEIPFTLIEENVIQALTEVAREASQGTYFEWFRIPAIQGGAGTSINMNMNEILANAALLKLGQKPGTYSIVDPFLHANIYQSTNDVIPSALKICIAGIFDQLAGQINNTRQHFERLEQEYNRTLRIAHTQMQQAVPSTYGRLFSTYSEALSRDWWRISKCIERLKPLNLGGGAAGTALGIPRFFVMEIVGKIREITGLPFSRSENMSDTTANLDAFVEVHAILKAHAVNLEKIVNDLRLLASDLSHGEIIIPQRQAGSSIMPAKVNPVIPEYIISIAHKVYANDQLVTSLCAQSCLDLNAYIPTIGDALIESLLLLRDANVSLEQNLLKGLKLVQEKSTDHFFKSPSITTALVPTIGYHKATELALLMKEKRMTIFEANKELNLMPEERLHLLFKPENLLKEGFSIKD